jgi:glycosyltransferase involved in cell wall biosynthesis
MIIVFFLFLILSPTKLSIINEEGNTNLERARISHNEILENKIEEIILKKFDNNLPLFVIVPTYNNIKYCQKNLKSILCQKYKFFNVIIIDDASTDGTAMKIEELIKLYDVGDKVTLIKNRKRKLLLENYVHAIKGYCPKNSVIIPVDGDDWLHNENVFSEIVEIFSQGKTWLTYGNCLRVSSGKRSDKVLGEYWGKAIPKYFFESNYIRKNRIWFFDQLRCFWAWLFFKINESDLRDYAGNFYTAAQDVAWFIPMLEMAGPEHVFFINKLQYVYNDSTNYNSIKMYPKLIPRIVDDIMRKDNYQLI